VFTYFRVSEASTSIASESDGASLRAFKEKLKELGHSYTVYENVDALQLHFIRQLDKLVASGFIELKSDSADAVIPGAITYQALLTGSGAIAQGPGAVGSRDVNVGRPNTGSINTGVQVNTGGAFVSGSEHVQGHFVGRDRIMYVERISDGVGTLPEEPKRHEQPMMEPAPEALVSLPAARREATTATADAPTAREAPRTEPVDAAVFCPSTVGRATPFLAQVFLYPPAHAEVARAQAREADAVAERRGVLSLPLELPRGTRIDLRLEMPGLSVEEPDAALIWRGALAGAQFEVAVPADASLGTAVGRIRFSIAGVPAGTLRFQVTVAAVATCEAVHAAEIAVRRYHRAFVSYASTDRAEVLRRVQAFRIAGLSVFQDVLDLEPGDRWQRELYREIDNCDVVLLFWSRAAAASPWVAKEIDYALARNQGQDDRPPDIAPVPIEGPPIPMPPDKLRHLHFNDALLAHIAAAQATP
jgi:hypothetical protein